MNTFSPDQMYDVIQARHKDIRDSETAYIATKLVQVNQPSHIQAVVNTIAKLAQSVHSLSIKTRHQWRISTVEN